MNRDELTVRVIGGFNFELSVIADGEDEVFHKVEEFVKPIAARMGSEGSVYDVYAEDRHKSGGRWRVSGHFGDDYYWEGVSVDKAVELTVDDVRNAIRGMKSGGTIVLKLEPLVFVDEVYITDEGVGNGTSIREFVKDMGLKPARKWENEIFRALGDDKTYPEDGVWYPVEMLEDIVDSIELRG